MTVATIASITLDCPDADRLAAFYGELLGLPVEYTSDDGSAVALRAPGFYLSCVTNEHYQKPVWQGSPGQQLHLDLSVPDLDEGTEAALALGATLADPQPQPDMWRVLIDPAGHPFCLMLPFGE